MYFYNFFYAQPMMFIVTHVLNILSLLLGIDTSHIYLKDLIKVHKNTPYEHHKIMVADSQNRTLPHLLPTKDTQHYTQQHIADLFEKVGVRCGKKHLFLYELIQVIHTLHQCIASQRSFCLYALNHLQHLQPEEITILKHIAEYYAIKMGHKPTKAQCFKLLKRVDIVPSSLIIAQAICESGWGQAPIMRRSHGIFGHMQNPKLLKRYKTLHDAVAAHMHLLNIHPAYKAFRTERQKIRQKAYVLTGAPLAATLLHYSERRHHYISDLTRCIYIYKLHKFDHNTN